LFEDETAVTKEATSVAQVTESDPSTEAPTTINGESVTPETESITPLPTTTQTASPTVTYTLTPSITPTTCAIDPPANWVSTTIVPGDTLFGLANLHSTSIDQIVRINCLSNTNISVGSTIYLPELPTPTPTCTPTPTLTPAPTSPPLSSEFSLPLFSFVEVETNQYVTIQTIDFPSNLNFTVYMGPYGELSGYPWEPNANAVIVDTINSGAGGTFLATFPIPAELYDAYQVAVRLESPQDYFAYNWFYNNLEAAGTGSGC